MEQRQPLLRFPISAVFSPSDATTLQPVTLVQLSDDLCMFVGVLTKALSPEPLRYWLASTFGGPGIDLGPAIAPSTNGGKGERENGEALGFVCRR